MQRNLRLYVGTYTDPILFGTGQIFKGKGEGLYVYELDVETLEATLVEKKTGVANPSFLDLAPSGRFLYAVNELKEYDGRKTGSLSAFSLDSAGRSLKLLNKKPTAGTDPCHVAVDASGKFVIVANYMSGSVCAFPLLPDGSLGEASDFVQHRGSSVNPARQSGPHAHSIVYDRENRHIFVSDLGTDEIVVYAWDRVTGKLLRRDELCLKAKSGAGPRHLVLHPKAPFAYLINELASTISALSYDAARASFAEIQSISTLPEDFKGASNCADLHVSPTGDFLYASNRGHDSVAAFRIERETGRLESVGHCFSGGNTPRNFEIDPSGVFLFAANQDSDNIVIFRIDPDTGTLKPTGKEIKVPTPVCVRAYKA